MNTNPTLVMGLAMDYAERTAAGRGDGTLNKYARERMELRVYPQTGSGYWFVTGHSAGRWYYKEEPDADHFSRAEMSELEAAIAAGVRVQVCGARGESYGLWKSWQAFAAEVG